MSSCLVIIDVQEGFLNEYTQQIPERLEELFQNENRFDHIVATKFVNVKDGPFPRLMGWKKMMDPVSIKVLPVVEEHSERIFTKEGFTCFTPEFEKYLIDENIDHLAFAGINTDCCVLKSACDCFERNIPLEVLLPCCASTGGPETQRAGIQVLERLIGTRQLAPR